MLARITSSLSRRIMVVNLFVRSAPAEVWRRPCGSAEHRVGGGVS